MLECLSRAGKSQTLPDFIACTVAISFLVWQTSHIATGRPQP